MDGITGAFIALRRAAGEKPTVNITEAAELLQVSRKRVWALIRQGKLSPIQNPLDRRERLIPVDQLVRVLPVAVEETVQGVTTRGTEQGKRPEPGLEDGWPVPLSDGAGANPDFQSSDYEEYLESIWARE